MAQSLHLITTILDPHKNRSTWAFSLANDASTYYSKFYFDNRIRVHVDGKLHNYYLIVILMYKQHTGENMFTLMMHVLDVICPQWRRQLIRVGSDGTNSMTGHLQGVVTCLARESMNTKFYRVWCGLHQLNLVLNHTYTELWENEVVNIMKKFIVYLRQQPGLITDMKATCPQLTPRWLVMGNVCKWLLAKRLELFDHINTAEKPIVSAPPAWWWIVIAGMNALTDFINPVFIKLQASSLLLSTQFTLLDSLAVDLCTMIRIRHLEERVFEEKNVTQVFSIVNGRWCVGYTDIVEFIEDLRMYPQHTLQQLNDDTHHKVIQSIGELALKIVNEVVNIQAERNQQNHVDSDLPHVLPHELIKISTCEFGKTTVDVHLCQLRNS